MLCSLTKLRINRPAPASSTSDSATSATTSVLSTRVQSAAAAVTPAFAHRIARVARRDERGHETEQMPVASAVTIVNATTGRSSATWSSRGIGMRSPTSASRPR